MNQGTNLGSQIGRWIILAAVVALLGALLLTIRPVVAQQTTGCQTVGTNADNRKAVCYYEFVEHGTGEVATLSALERDITQVVKVWELVTDENDPAGSPADFSDYGHFRIDRDSAKLTFKSPPDYENPGSAAAVAEATMTLEDENVYKVKAKVGDGEKFLPVEITVQVRGKEEPGTVTFSNRQPEVGVKLTATLSDGDIRGLRTPDWQWEVETDTGSGVFEEIDEAVNAAYTPRAGDADKKLKVIAQYEDSHGRDYAEVSRESEFAVRAAPAPNVAPRFRDTDDDTETSVIDTSRRIEENSAPGIRVGPPVFATDDNHLAADDADDPGGPRDVLTYSLGDGDAGTPEDGATEDDGLFSIDQITGQIMTKAGLNKEGLSARDPEAADGIQLQVTANATDPSGEIGRAIVTIHVLDVDEAPQVRGPAALTYFENQDPAGVANLILFRNPDQSDADLPDPAHPSPVDVTPDNQATYMATDNDLDDPPEPELGDIEWQITGPDASKFQFEESTGTYTPSVTENSQLGETPAVLASPVLLFRSAPDLESAADVGGTPGDNVYEITVVAWDEDWEIGRRDVTIRVADSNDAGMITLSHVRPQVGTPITATLKDQDDISTSVKWQWYRGTADANDTADGDGATTDTYTPQAGDLTADPTIPSDHDQPLFVRAMYTDGGGNTEMPEGMASANMRDNPLGDDESSTIDVDESGVNTPPKFYEDGVLVSDIANRKAEDEVTRYTRYVLENQTIQLTNTELEARVDDNDDSTDGHQVPDTGRVNVFDGYFENLADRVANPQEVKLDSHNLQFDLRGTDAKYFTITQSTGDETESLGGLISTERALDFETKSTYTVTVRATDPAGMYEDVTVTIEVLDVPEIQGLESRIRVDENTKEIADLYNSYAQKTNLGGLKWSLLTAADVGNVDCQADPDNQGLCDDFRFSRFNTSNTKLLFAIGIGEKHDAPNFEKPADVGIDDTDTAGDKGDNVYKIVVRVAFANLRSFPAVDPQDDEKNDGVVWIRVDDVDEDPKFTDDDSTRLIIENSDDFLPSIAINRDVVGTVKATDQEYEYTDGPQFDKKLTYSLSLPEAYSNLFQIVPSSGDILTRARLNYEALSELDEMGPDGGQHRIITVPGVGPRVTATDSAMPMGNSDDIDANIRVNDVNETPIPVEDLFIAGEATVADYAEMQDDTTVGTYTVSGDNAATAAWSLGGADMRQFMLEGTGLERTLKFASARDFEATADADGDNVYMVTIQARHDDADTATRAVAITVTNVQEDGAVILNPSRPSVGTAITATLEDDDIVSSESWQWASSDAMDGPFTNISGATSATYTPVAADADMWLRAMATYTDVLGSGNVEMKVTDSAVTLLAINGPNAVDRAENGTSVATYTADSALTITWTVSGDDAGAFNIRGGQLTFSPAPDYEAPADTGMNNVYNVTVEADDGTAMDSQDVTVTVTDMDEGGTVTVMPMSAMVGTELTASLSDPDTGVTNITWQWASAGTDIDDATSASYTVAEEDAGMSLEVTATYDDVHANGQMATSEAVMIIADTVAGYDRNNDGEISRSELFDAVEDYFNGDLDRSDLFDVIEAYFG